MDKAAAESERRAIENLRREAEKALRSAQRRGRMWFGYDAAVGLAMELQTEADRRVAELRRAYPLY